MSNRQFDHTGSAKFKPISNGDFYTHSEIVKGTETTATGRRGIGDLILNNNTLCAQVQNDMIFCFPDDGTYKYSVTNNWGSTDDQFDIKVPMMSFSQRAKITVEAVVHVSASTLGRMDVDSPDGNTYQNSSGSGVQTISADVVIDPTDTWSASGYTTWPRPVTIKITFTARPTSADPATVTVISLRVFQTPLAVGALLSAGAQSGGFVAADDAITTDFALPVKTMRELRSSALHMYRDAAARPVFCWAWPKNSNATDSNNPMIASEWEPVELAQFTFMKRPGVDHLVVVANGYTDSYTSGEGAKYWLRISQSGSFVIGEETGSCSFTLDQSSASWTVGGNWAAQDPGGILDVSGLSVGLHTVSLYGACQRNLRVTTAGSGYSQYDTVKFAYATGGADTDFNMPTAWLKTAGSLSDANLEWVHYGSSLDQDHSSGGLTVASPYMITTTGSSGVVVLDRGHGYLQSILVYEKPLAT